MSNGVQNQGEIAMQTDKYTKVVLTLIAVGIFLSASSIYAGPVKKATVIGALAGVGTSTLIIGLDPKDKDPYSRSSEWFGSSSGVNVKDKYNGAQILTIGVATGILVGALSYFYFDGKSESHSMISNKEFEKAWKRVGMREYSDYKSMSMPRVTTLHQLRIQPSFKGLTIYKGHYR